MDCLGSEQDLPLDHLPVQWAAKECTAHKAVFWCKCRIYWTQSLESYRALD